MPDELIFKIFFLTASTLALFLTPASKTMPSLGIVNSAVLAAEPAQSESAELELAEHLQKIGAKIYGSDICPMTALQRQIFGEPAFAKINYIECNPGAKNSQAPLCQNAHIEGTPTWEINGHFYRGLKSLHKLGRISNYQGSYSFKTGDM